MGLNGYLKECDQVPSSYVSEGDSLPIDEMELNSIIDNIDLSMSSKDWIKLESALVALKQNKITLPNVNYETLVSKVLKYLEISMSSSQAWDSGCDSKRYYYGLRVLQQIVSFAQDPFACLISASIFIKTNTPWSNEENSKICSNIIEEVKRQPNFTFESGKYFEFLRPNLLSLSSLNNSKNNNINNNLGNEKISRQSGYKGKKSSVYGLKPSLGYNSANEDNARDKWKKSVKIKAIPMTFFFIQYSNDLLDEWPLITSFILNLIEDHQVFYKSQACDLLTILSDKFPHILVKSGLLPLFIDSSKICLSYLPNLTPESESIYALTSAFPAILNLLQIEQNIQDYIIFVNANILTSIQHVRGGSDKIMLLLLEQLNYTIKDYMKIGVFACISRIFFTINQIMADPIIFDKGKDIAEKLTSACLNIQRSVFNLIHDDDEMGTKLLEKYYYDFLGIWIIVYERFTRENISYQEIQSNYYQLCKKSTPKLAELVEIICEKKPALVQLFNNNRQ